VSSSEFRVALFFLNRRSYCFFDFRLTVMDDDLLPTKSRGKYEQQYNVFTQWAKSNKVGKITENVLLAYFAENAKLLKPSTLWSQYSMLHATLAIKKDIHINTFSKLIAFLKQKSAGFKPKKSKTLTKSEVEKFLLNAPDEKYLMTKVMTHLI
jgi:tRNA 2-selenouridine synthase SelU